MHFTSFAPFLLTGESGKSDLELFFAKTIRTPILVVSGTGAGQEGFATSAKVLQLRERGGGGGGGRSNLAQSKKSSENARKDDRAISF